MVIDSQLSQDGESGSTESLGRDDNFMSSAFGTSKVLQKAVSQDVHSAKGG